MAEKRWFEERTPYIAPEAKQVIDAMSRYDLEDLEIAIKLRHREIMAAGLERAGFTAQTSRKFANGSTYVFPYVLVFAPDGAEGGNQFATNEECRRLLDTASNLPIVEAFNRWVAKIEPLIVSSDYSNSDAIADMKRERASTKQRYNCGDIDSADFRTEWESARGLLSYAK